MENQPLWPNFHYLPREDRDCCGRTSNLKFHMRHFVTASDTLNLPIGYRYAARGHSLREASRYFRERPLNYEDVQQTPRSDVKV